MTGDKTGRRAAAAAILEVAGVYAGGQLVTWLFCLLLGIEPVSPLRGLVPMMENDAMLGLAWSLAAILLLQAAGWLLLALPLLKVRRQSLARSLACERRPAGIPAFLLTGLVLFAVAELPGRSLAFLGSVLEPGKYPGLLGILLEQDWGLPGFWALTGVGSFGLVPVLEELFYRGFCQSRLVKGLGAPAGIATTAVLFTFSHSQYLQPNAVNLLTLAGILFSSLAYGVVVWRSGSLLPAIVAHMLVNIPLRPGLAQWVLWASMLVIAIVARRKVLLAWQAIRQLFANSGSWRGVIGASLVGLLLALALWQFQNILILLGLPCIVLALLFDRPVLVRPLVGSGKMS